MEERKRRHKDGKQMKSYRLPIWLPSLVTICNQEIKDLLAEWVTKSTQLCAFMELWTYMKIGTTMFYQDIEPMGKMIFMKSYILYFAHFKGVAQLIIRTIWRIVPWDYTILIDIKDFTMEQWNQLFYTSIKTSIKVFTS